MMPTISSEYLFDLLNQEAPQRIKEYQEWHKITMKQFYSIRDEITQLLAIIEMKFNLILSQIEQSDFIIPFYYKLTQAENQLPRTKQEIFAKLENFVYYEPSPICGKFHFKQNSEKDSLQQTTSQLMTNLQQAKQLIESISDLEKDQNESKVKKNQVSEQSQRKKVKLDTLDQLTQNESKIQQIDTLSIKFQLMQQLEGHQAAITSVAISHNDQYIASASGSRVYLWDLRNKTIIKQYQGQQNVKNIQFSKNNLRLAVIGYYGFSQQDISVYDIGDFSKNDPIRVIKGISQTNNNCRTIFTNSTNHIITTIVADNTVSVWDTNQMKEISKCQCANWVFGICLSDNEELIGCCCQGGLAYLFDSKSLNLLNQKVQWQAHTSTSCCIEFIKNSKLILTSSRTEIRVWEVEDLLNDKKECVKQIQSIYRNQYIWSVKALPVSDPKVIIASQGSFIRIWQMEPTLFQQEIELVGGTYPNGQNFAITSDLKTMVTTAQDKILKIYQLEQL